MFSYLAIYSLLLAYHMGPTVYISLSPSSYGLVKKVPMGLCCNNNGMEEVLREEINKKI